MMFYVENSARDISSMPRGGPNASWLDRRLQTDRLEYLTAMTSMTSNVGSCSLLTVPGVDGGSASMRNVPAWRFGRWRMWTVRRSLNLVRVWVGCRTSYWKCIPPHR